MLYDIGYYFIFVSMWLYFFFFFTLSLFRFLLCFSKLEKKLFGDLDFVGFLRRFLFRFCFFCKS